MEFPIFKDILIIFALSTLVNYAFNRIKVPTIVGYLLTGVFAGPHLTGIVTSSESIHTLAEIGVVLLLFTIGLEFSLKHLIKIRRIVFVGGFMQVFVTAALIMLVARSYEMDLFGAIFIGFITALSSTAVVLKVLQDRDELTSNYGRTVLGILIFQDILLVPLLLFTPILGGDIEGVGSMIFYLGIKSVLIIAMVYVGHKWVMPWVLHLIAMTKNQELYFMSILLICLGIAFLTNELGMSLAFGAFLAGLMISESEHSHHIYGHIIPFKDIFTSFFFVSIGMMLDLDFVRDHLSLVLITVLVVMAIKAFVAGITGFVLGHTFRGFILVGLALAQVGEFSFILVQMGLGYGIVSDFYYQLFLATAVTTMSLTPFQIMLSRPLSTWLVSLPLPKVLIEGMFPLKQVDVPEMKSHLVLIGKDSRSRNISAMAGYIHLPYISIAFDPAEVKKRQERGETIIYGDAANEPILKKAHIDSAEVVVVSIGDMITAMSIVEKVRHLNKHAAILVRTRYVEDVEELYRVGATQVIPEEFETAIEVFERVLNKYLIPQSDISQIIGRIRKDNYGVVRQSVKSSRFSIMKELPNIEISALKVNEHSLVVGKNLAELDFRKNAGVTVVAIKRSDLIVENPMADTRFKKGDIVYVLGKQDQIAHTVKMFMAK
jgi:CPA2 family monovalent cation:H+ antiporter-2